jgi:hypothetical protein
MLTYAHRLSQIVQSPANNNVYNLSIINMLLQCHLQIIRRQNVLLSQGPEPMDRHFQWLNTIKQTQSVLEDQGPVCLCLDLSCGWFRTKVQHAVCISVTLLMWYDSYFMQYSIHYSVWALKCPKPYKIGSVAVSKSMQTLNIYVVLCIQMVIGNPHLYILLNDKRPCQCPWKPSLHDYDDDWAWVLKIHVCIIHNWPLSRHNQFKMCITMTLVGICNAVWSDQWDPPAAAIFKVYICFL